MRDSQSSEQMQVALKQLYGLQVIIRYNLYYERYAFLTILLDMYPIPS